MVSSPNDDRDSQVKGSVSPVASEKPKADWASQFDSEQIFRLIDSILPFEACLYHQILPLRLEGSRLKLGMVNPDDSAALDYVRRILAYMNCSLTPQTIASDLHHVVLSAYLNYTDDQKKPVNPRSNSASKSIAKRIEKKLAQKTAKSESPEPGSDSESSHLNGQDPHSQPTLLVNSPEDLNFQDLDVANPQAPPPAVLSEPTTDDSYAERSQSSHNGQQPTLILKSDPASASDVPPEVPSHGETLPVLQVNAKHLSDPAEVLMMLPPDELLQELLGRVLVGGIGRLYLERQSNKARVLWSQNGVLQSILEELPLETLQGVINELKLLTGLPLISVQKPRQVEIERLYESHRLLLRLRVMPSNIGEEATVQVLRGAALKFYQQQQLANLSRDALSIAQNLQQKVNEIRVRTRFYPMLTADQLSILPALDKILKSVEQQLDDLKALQLAEAQKEEGE
jgi:type II secretory ATPase GspE/PulE/Tfp pilus assembly ATPase PilB-like protein